MEYRTLCVEYFKQYLDSQQAQDIEEKIYASVTNEKEYKRKARLFLHALDRNTWSYHHGPLPCASDLHPQRWESFRLAEHKVETTLAEQQKPVATTLYTCGKCKKNECTFYERATRGGDESLTTFITCIHCGHKWKQ